MYHLLPSFLCSQTGKHNKKVIWSGYSFICKTNLQQMKFKKYIIKWAYIILTFQWEMNVLDFN